MGRLGRIETAINNINTLLGQLGQGSVTSTDIAQALVQAKAYADAADTTKDAATLLSAVNYAVSHLNSVLYGSNGASGYVRLPTGIIIQWGKYSGTMNAPSYGRCTFNTTFPSALLSVIPSLQSDLGNDQCIVLVKEFSTSYFDFDLEEVVEDDEELHLYYIAIGY
jgi:hypothetical protein